MQQANLENNRHSEYFHQMRAEMTVFASVGFILDKIEEDNNLKHLTSLFQQILDKEMAYAIKGNFIRASWW